MQQINLEFQVQKTMLPYERVIDMSLARDALKLIDTNLISPSRSDAI